MRTNPKITQVLKVADKDFKRCITTMLSEIKENISLKWMKTENTSKETNQWKFQNQKIKYNKLASISKMKSKASVVPTKRQ